MKNLFPLLIIMTLTVLCLSCKKSSEDSTTTGLGGDPSPMGQVGTTVSSSSIEIAGLKNFSGSVISLKNGVSTYTGKATVTNSLIKNMLANVPQVVTTGDTVSTTSVQIKSTTAGIESVAGLRPGIVVNYSSVVGDKYAITSSSDKRTVVSKSTTDDYFYGFLMIKVMKIEETVSGALKSTTGLDKITYWANHRFGLVGIEFSYSDGSSANFPLYTSTENP